MKRFFLLLLALGLTLSPLLAQKGLQTEQLFGSELRNRKGSTEVLVTGTKAARYGLTLFRSLTFCPTKQESAWAERLVRADRAQAVSMEEGRRNARLYYGFYELEAKDKQMHRYLFYRNNQLKDGAKGTVIVIYMEGSATVAALKRHFAQ